MFRIAQWLRCGVVMRPPNAAAESARGIYQRMIVPHAATGELATLAAELEPLIAAPGALSVAQKYHLVDTLSTRLVRHEGVLLKCMWDILKAELARGESADAANRQLAMCTASTFRVMARLGFRNDHQMVALALGRCVELAPVMPLGAVVEVYQALAEMDLTYFSLSSVALYESDVNADLTVKDALVSDTVEGRHSYSELANQPNLVDVLCAELEARLAALSSTTPLAALDVLADQAALVAVDPPPAGPLATHSQASSATAAPDRDGHDALQHERFLATLSRLGASLSSVGAASPEIFATLQGLLNLAVPRLVAATGRRGGDREMGGRVVGHLVAVVGSVARVPERVVDPMNHDPSVEFADERDALTKALASQLCRVAGLEHILRRDPPLVLSARKMFEEMPDLAELSPALWDHVRAVRVAQKHVVAAKMGGRSAPARIGGKLFESHMAVKLKPISQDLSSAERFVPPQFKTWRSPAHKRRGGHVPTRGSGKMVKFGTRRISKDYLKKRQRAFSRGT